MKVLGGIGFLINSALSLMFYMVGMHGHLMFRPHMTEDWVIWGIAVVSATLGLILIFKGFKNRNN